MSTVPQGAAATNSGANVPQQIPTGGQTFPPSKPSATTGPGGPSVSIPRVGKSGK